MTLLDAQKAGFIYQHRPDIFPEGYLTDTEVLLWNIYYFQKSKTIENHKARRR